MKPLQVLPLIATVFLGSCDSKIGREAASPDSSNELHQYAWQPIRKSLKEYSTADPDRPIIAHIWASWDATGQVPRFRLQSAEVSDALTSAGFLCLEGDITESDPLLLEAIEMLDRKAPPVTAIYYPSTREWRVCPEVFTADEAIQWARR
jgi:thiol:disulfide interchange protein